MPSTIDALKASLEAARVGFLTATTQMNAAKSLYEDAKTRLETESDKQKLRISDLEKQLGQCVKEKKDLQDAKDSENQIGPGPGQRVSNPKVFMDIGGNGLRIAIELFKDTTPRAAEHFRTFFTGEKGFAPNGRPLHYKGSPFNFEHSGEVCSCAVIMIGGSSGPKLSPENFSKKHSGAGDVCVFEAEQSDPNWSYFFITLSRVGKWVGNAAVLGRVVEGLNELTAAGKAGARQMMITNSGELP